MSFITRFLITLSPVLIGVVNAIDVAELPPPAKHEINFAKEIWPLFQKHCMKCHGPEKQKSGYRIDIAELALEGGEMGVAIIPGNSAKSPLIHFISGLDEEVVMPPKGDPFNAKTVGLIRAWIDQGADWPDAIGAKAVNRMDHWSFKQIVQPKIPQAINPIDAFIKSRLKEAKLDFNQRADKRTLIRRLYLVMHGLPPTPDEVEAFVNDKDSNAFQRVVEKVLSSPRYGERWATHWLDLVRFGESHGFETNRERNHSWPYRDWVIRALNEDKPYNQLVREQLAGDALGEPIGTGFLVAGPHDIVKGQDPKLTRMQRANELDDIINTTGTVFLGLTTGCARCHNHKFDPISQNDYYALKGIFEGVKHADRNLPLSAADQTKTAAILKRIGELKVRLEKFITSDGKRPAITAKHNIETFPPVEARFVRFTITRSSTSRPCLDELEVFAGTENLALANKGSKASSGGDFKHPLHKLAHINDGQYGNAKSWIAANNTGWVQIELPKAARIDRIEWARDRQGKYSDRVPIGYYIETGLEVGEWKRIANSEDRQPFKGNETAKPVYAFDKLPKLEAERGRKLLAEMQSAEQQLKNLQDSTKAYVGTFTQPGTTRLFYRGDPESPREEVEPGALTKFVSLTIDAKTPEQKRRLALADWIVSDTNPLARRVIVNRIWQHHFGTGLVDTPNDFGRNGVAPTHPELLDWLASTLVSGGWSLKKLHRHILLTQTWQQSSRPQVAALKIDSTSQLLWRFPPRRLEAEAIRDAMLQISGVLDLKMGGPGFNGFEVQMENVRHFFPKKNYGTADWRRMIYMTKVRQEQESVFGAFDCPDASQGVPKRNRSTTPLQALNLLNSSFVMQQAGLFAKRLRKEVGEAPAAQAARAIELCFGRAPNTAELKDATAFIQTENLAQFTRAMLNANEFVFIP
jgi:hypothetical protein